MHAFIHALSGTDLTSFFFNQGKFKFWDRWHEFSQKDELTLAFANLSETPASKSEEQEPILEKFICSVYFGNESEKTVGELQFQIFRHTIICD